MPIGLADFFIRFLSDEGDIVLDPFAGSNTTGAAAEHLGRRWIAVEAREEYVSELESTISLRSGVYVMTVDDLFEALEGATSYSDAIAAIEGFEAAHGEDIEWVPVGGAGTTEVRSKCQVDPGRTLIERVTNGVDAVLEKEHDRRNGKPACRTPREAATA